MKTVIAALFAAFLAASLATSPASAALTPSAPYMTNACCDIYGNVRCVMSTFKLNGMPCVCEKGEGWAC